MNSTKLFPIFLSYILNDSMKYVLCRGAQFALPLKTMEYANYMVSFALPSRGRKTNN